MSISACGRFQFSTEKAYKREHLDAGPGRRFHYLAHRGDAFPVPFDPRHVALLGPPPVAVHDYRHVARQALPVDCVEQREGFLVVAQVGTQILGGRLRRRGAAHAGTAPGS